MRTRRILYFTAEHHYLYRSSGSVLELEATFRADDAAVGAFREHLRGCRQALFSVIADLAGEDFHEDQIPWLRGSDREAVVQRRLAQRYRDTRLAAALSLGQVAAGERRNERLLLASFTNTQQFAPWLQALDEAGVRLAGVFSVPLLAPALAARLGVRAGRCLVVTANRAGLRQCFVDNGRLRFARLERTVDMAPEALALFVGSETVRLAQYLTTLRALPRDGAPLQVLVVAPQGKRAEFEKALVSDARLTFRAVDIEEAARAVGVRRLPEGALAEALYLQLAVRKSPREQFASREDRRRYFVWQMQRALVAAGALGLAVCALVGGTRWLEAMQVRERAAGQQREAQAATEHYARITAGFPVTETSSENLKLTVVEFRRIAGESATPEPALVHVSRVLEQFPQMELDALNWKVGKPSDKRGPKPAAVPASPAAGAGKSEPQNELAVLIELSGRVNATQRSDYREITAQVQRFSAALSGSSGYELLHTQLPFDVTSEGTLTGDIGAAGVGEGNAADAPRFTIVLARRLR